MASDLMRQPWVPWGMFGFALLTYVALPALVAALLFRGGLLLLILRLAIVRCDGALASGSGSFGGPW